MVVDERLWFSPTTLITLIDTYIYKTVGERSFSFYGPQLWNSLPSHLRSIENFTTFKRELKTYLFEMYYTDS